MSAELEELDAREQATPKKRAALVAHREARILLKGKRLAAAERALPKALTMFDEDAADLPDRRRSHRAFVKATEAALKVALGRRNASRTEREAASSRAVQVADYLRQARPPPAHVARTPPARIPSYEETERERAAKVHKQSPRAPTWRRVSR